MDGNSYVISMNFVVYCLTNASVPAFSPKLVKTFIYLIRELDYVRKLYESKERFKPFAITPLFKDGRALICSQPHRVVAGDVLRFRISIAVPSVEVLESMSSIDTVVEPRPGRRFRVQIDEVEMVSVDSLSIDLDNRVVKMRFLSPVLLSTKLMAPPLPQFLKKVREVREKYVLYPSSAHICCYLAKLWNILFPHKPISRKYSDEWAAYFMGRLCEVVLVPMDLQIKPMTIVYDRNRKPRGFVGWALFDIAIKDRKVLERLSRLFALARYLGIGKSRSIGFGTVDIEPIPRKGEE